MSKNCVIRKSHRSEDREEPFFYVPEVANCFNYRTKYAPGNEDVERAKQFAVEMLQVQCDATAVMQKRYPVGRYNLPVLLGQVYGRLLKPVIVDGLTNMPALELAAAKQVCALTGVDSPAEEILKHGVHDEENHISLGRWERKSDVNFDDSLLDREIYASHYLEKVGGKFVEAKRTIAFSVRNLPTGEKYLFFTGSPKTGPYHWDFTQKGGGNENETVFDRFHWLAANMDYVNPFRDRYRQEALVRFMDGCNGILERRRSSFINGSFRFEEDGFTFSWTDEDDFLLHTNEGYSFAALRLREPAFMKSVTHDWQFGSRHESSPFRNIGDAEKFLREISVLDEKDSPIYVLDNPDKFMAF